MPRLMISCALAALVLVGVASRADQHEPPKYVSAAIEGANLTRLNEILDAMETLGTTKNNQEAIDCAKCLKNMLKHHRICLEAGTNKAAASTWRSCDGGKCGDAGDGMHVSPALLSNKYTTKTAMSVLAHEWRHTVQPKSMPRAQAEVEGYSQGKALLVLCGITTGKLIDWYDKKIAAWQAKVRPVGRAPGEGAKSALKSDAPPVQLDIFSGDFNLYAGTPDDPMLGSLPLQRLDNTNSFDPTDLLIHESTALPPGVFIAIVTGIDAIDHTTGVIQYIETDGNSANILGEIILPGVHPFTVLPFLHPNPDLNRLFILDTLGDQILVLDAFPGDPVGLPQQLVPFPFATAAQTPKLQTALEFRDLGQRDALVLGDQDGRADDLGLYQELVVQLIDTDLNGQADQVFAIEQHSRVQSLPHLDRDPVHGETNVLLFGTPGTTLQIRATNEDGTQLLEVLGNVIPGTDYMVDATLPRPLVVGEFIQAIDTGSIVFPSILPPYPVQPCPADLTGSADPNSPAFGVPDGLTDANDFFYYLHQFAAGDLDAADLTGSTDPNDPQYGVPDGVLDANDFFFYLTLFAQPCP